jgi:hypothetical protein
MLIMRILYDLNVRICFAGIEFHECASHICSCSYVTPKATASLQHCALCRIDSLLCVTKYFAL